MVWDSFGAGGLSPLAEVKEFTNSGGDFLKRISLFLAVLIVINALFVSVAGAEYITRAEAARLLYGLCIWNTDYIPRSGSRYRKSEFSPRKPQAIRIAT